ncbi:MAG: hypothetical protein LBV18_06185 [Alistipes sp.]|jgi:hypothetical protein|nr:hypothetical protein [Alistipes sp.]
MNRQNIIAAGRMMAIVVALLGAMYCGVAVAPLIGSDPGLVGMLRPGVFGVAPLWSVVSGGVLIVCGLAMMATFGRAERRPSLASVVLAVASLVAAVGIAAVAVVYINPFSWMAAIVGLAIFIDALCLKISLRDDH